MAWNERVIIAGKLFNDWLIVFTQDKENIIMWSSFTQFVLQYLDPISIVLGVVLAFPVFHTWYEVSLGRKRRQRQLYKQIRKQPGNRPGVLIVDLLPGKDIYNSVTNYIEQESKLREISKERHFILRRDHAIKPEHMPEFHRELGSVASKVTDAGIGTLHFFYAGPAIMAAVVGAEFSNNCLVVLYQHNQGSYECYGPLKKPINESI